MALRNVNLVVSWSSFADIYGSSFADGMEFVCMSQSRMDECLRWVMGNKGEQNETAIVSGNSN